MGRQSSPHSGGARRAPVWRDAPENICLGRLFLRARHSAEEPSRTTSWCAALGPGLCSVHQQRSSASTHSASPSHPEVLFVQIMPTCCPHPRIWAGALERCQFCRTTLTLPFPPRRAGCRLSPHSASPGLGVTREGQWRRVKVLKEEGGLLWLHYMEWPPSLPSTIHSFIHVSISQSVTSVYWAPTLCQDVLGT